ncbi:MAG: fatty acid desaturase [Bauldia sp.]
MSSAPIPAGRNLSIGAVALAACAALLWLAAHGPWWCVLGSAIAFSFANNTLFSLLHEAVHGNFSPNRRVNLAAGRIFAALFPTSFTVQRVSHLGHHRRNRSDVELYDYVLPGQSWWLKAYWIYCLLTGFYWLAIPMAGLVYFLCPWGFRSRAFLEGPARWWGFEPFIADVRREPPLRIWLEYAFAGAVQAGLFLLLDLNWAAWFACYWAFGLNWSSVQYTDHAWSVRDTIEGAWNLKRWPFIQAVFLNYNLHLAHHREPGLPWTALPQQLRPQDPMPGFWTIYRRLWLGPRPAPAVTRTALHES